MLHIYGVIEMSKMWLPMCSLFVQYSLSLHWRMVFPLVLGFSVNVNHSTIFARGEDIGEKKWACLHTSTVDYQARIGKTRQMEGR